MDDGIAAVNGECDARLVEDESALAFDERERVSGFVDDHTASSNQGRVGGIYNVHAAADPWLIVHIHFIAPPH
jgi:hypothetical protein